MQTTKEVLETGSAEDQPPADAASTEAEPSTLTGIDFAIPRGQLVCVVGPIGSGKSSLLQGLIGEMRKVRGDVIFGEWFPCSIHFESRADSFIRCRRNDRLLGPIGVATERDSAREHCIWPPIQRETVSFTQLSHESTPSSN